MIGSHCIKTWSSTQGAYALSCAEAEFYAMVEAVTRSDGLIYLAQEIGLKGLNNIVHLGMHIEDAESFVNRQGVGRMTHIEIRDMWLRKEVRDGRVTVSKIPGVDNPADLMTKTFWGQRYF